MSLLRRRAAGDGDQGAIAVLVAVLSIVLFGVAALAVDISSLMVKHENLQNTLDAAAVTAAYSLPIDLAGAKTAALDIAAKNDPTSKPTVDFWCIIASLGPTNMTPDTNQIPGTCNPGAGPYSVSKYPGLVCNDTRCAIPCNPAIVGNTCNTIRVNESQPVAFSFAPLIGIKSGSTGSLVSIACKGSCGADVPNPMDVVVVADRTGSMAAADRNAMIGAIKGMFTTMTPTQQYVGFATIGKSKTVGTCTTGDSGSTTSGTWVPIPFSNDYLTSGGTLSASSNLVKGVTCLPQSSTGTHLASSFKGAARYLLGLDSNNLSSLPVRVGTPTKAIIFETDGQPNDSGNSGSTNLSVSGDIESTTNSTACNNFKAVAANAKAAGILVVTIGFGDAAAMDCSGANGPATVLAGVASPDSKGKPSVANTACTTPAERTAENTDGDNYFCAAAGADLANIFKTAIAQLSGSIRLINLPA